MLVEAVLAVIVGAGVLWLVLQPVLQSSPGKALPAEPVDPEETPKGIALTALKEIEFDRETGKLSDSDYEFLKGKYTAQALDALRQESEEAASDNIEDLIAAKVRALRSASTSPSANASHSAGLHPSCISCGPRPEPDAAFCSSCGRRLLSGAACHSCGATLSPESKFCESCGQRVAA